MNHKNQSFYFWYGLLGVFLYCLMAIIFVAERSKFANLYLLYVGNFLFCASIFLALIEFNKIFGGNASFWTLLGAGFRLTVYVIVVSCIILAILLLLGHHKELLYAPPNTFEDNTNGLRSILYLDAILVNFFVGAFASLFVALSSKLTQKTVEN
jgi:hypothetical protein